MSPLPHRARSACMGVKSELLSCFSALLSSSRSHRLSLSSTLPLSRGADSWQTVNIHTFRGASASINEDRFSGSPCNWLSFFFFSPSCYSLFIQPAFSTSAAPILTVLLSNWQPTLSLKCKKCFITMGPAKPLIMHGNMPVKTECIYFCGKSCCFGQFQGSLWRYLHSRAVFCLNLHNLKL